MVGAKLLHSSLALLTLRSRALSAFALPLLHTLRSSLLFYWLTQQQLFAMFGLRKLHWKFNCLAPASTSTTPLSHSLLSSPSTCALSRSLTLHLHYLCISRWGLRRLRQRLRCWMFSVFASFPFCMCCVISVAKSVKRERKRGREVERLNWAHWGSYKSAHVYLL